MNIYKCMTTYNRPNTRRYHMQVDTHNKDQPDRKEALSRNYLIDLKLKAGLTTDLLASRIFLDRKNYYQLESGTRGHRMSAILYVRLAKELKVSVEELVRREAAYQRKRIKKGLSKEPWYSLKEEQSDEY